MAFSWKQLSMIGVGIFFLVTMLLVYWSTAFKFAVRQHLKDFPQITASFLPEAQELAKQEIETKIAKQQLIKNELAVKSQYLPRYAATKFYMVWGLIGLGFLGGAGSLAVWWWIYWKRQSVFTYRIGDNEIVVPERELPNSTTIALGLITAEQLKQENSGLDRAFELYEALANSQTKMITALGKHRPMLAPSALSEGTPAITAQTVPTFADLLQTDLAEGKPMILGFTQDGPRYGSFLDIYSSAIAGESGSGKTITMLFLIASGLVTQGVRYYEIDPHYPHPKSLGFKTKLLWEAGLMKHAGFKDDMVKLLREVEGIIDARLDQEDTDTTPVVLVIDELVLLSKSTIGAELARVMERISTEGRKCQVYLLASSQTWLVARTGDSSVVRDTLTSAFVHRIKPKQANLLLQDKDAMEKMKHIKRPGQVLLCPVIGESVICQIPEVRDEDMVQVKEVVNGNSNIIPFPAEAAKGYDHELLSKDLILAARERHGQPYETFYDTLAAQAGVSASMIKKICGGARGLTPEMAKKLQPYL